MWMVLCHRGINTTGLYVAGNQQLSSLLCSSPQLQGLLLPRLLSVAATDGINIPNCDDKT
jgi:hypothetical protein